MRIYSMKDLPLTRKQVNDFDRAMDAKEIVGSKKKEM